MAWEVEIKQERRLCKVNGQYGYFHTWEQHSRMISKSRNDGKNIGNISSVFGIVELADKVIRVDPEYIIFCDEESEYLRGLNECSRMEDDLK